MKLPAFAFLSFAFFCCVPAAQAQERTLRISNDGTYPPFSGINTKGKMFGFDIDIARALCNEMKVHCEFVKTEWDDLIPALNARKADAIVASLNSTSERKKVVTFTAPYYQNPARFVCRKDASPSIDGKTLGVLRGSVFDNYAENRLKNLSIKRYATQMDAYISLRAKRIDLLLTDSLVLESNFLNRPESRPFELCLPPVTDPQYFGDGIAIAVRQSDKELVEEFNAAIRAIRASGEYQKISQQYFGRDIYQMPP